MIQALPLIYKFAILGAILYGIGKTRFGAALKEDAEYNDGVFGWICSICIFVSLIIMVVGWGCSALYFIFQMFWG